MNPDEKQQLRPADESFPYYLEVNDHHNPDDGIVQYPRYGWACLWRHEPGEPVCDANPYPEVYLQEQTFTYDEYADTELLGDPGTGIAATGVMYPHQVGEFEGWEEGPARLWQFFEAVRDEYYECGVEPDEIPVRVALNGPTIVTESTGAERAVYEIYFRDPEGGEYLMWNSDELYGETEPNSELIQKVVSAFADAYEAPDDFLNQWGYRRTQIESCDPRS